VRSHFRPCMSRAKGAELARRKNTYCVLGPKLGSALGHPHLHKVLLGATVFGFEIKGGLHEVRAARLAKETVTDGEIVERFLDGLQLVCSADVFVITRL